MLSPFLHSHKSRKLSYQILRAQIEYTLSFERNAMKFKLWNNGLKQSLPICVFWKFPLCNPLGGNVAGLIRNGEVIRKLCRIHIPKPNAHSFQLFSRVWKCLDSCEICIQDKCCVRHSSYSWSTLVLLCKERLSRIEAYNIFVHMIAVESYYYYYYSFAPQSCNCWMTFHCKNLDPQNT